jgi:hypothetical protein
LLTGAIVDAVRRQPYYAGGMDATGLPARIVYTAIAAPVTGAGAFYSCMGILPEFTASYPQLDPSSTGYGIFKIAVCVGIAVAVTAALLTLTLPWIRHRKLKGRGLRMGISAVLVVVAAVAFSDEGFKLGYDLLFAAWLTYVMAYTFVRYGVTEMGSGRRARRARRAD